jgi:TPP-dependent indolepyruvate ferredoxin oxidoreductase alpha subunit
VQALVRLPMLQRTRDAMAGLNTAGFISGYRGSPLGGYDQALWQAKKHLQAQHIVFQPGVNEELGATAVWGTQQLDLFPRRPSTTACSACGTARARAWTAASTSSSTPTWPAPAASAASSPSPATTT